MTYWEWSGWEEWSCEEIKKKAQEHQGKVGKATGEIEKRKQETRDGGNRTFSMNDSGHVSEERQK